MNTLDELDDDIPTEIDFSGGERGKFYRPNARLNLPACPGDNDNLHAPAEPRKLDSPSPMPPAGRASGRITSA